MRSSVTVYRSVDTCAVMQPLASFAHGALLSAPHSTLKYHLLWHDDARPYECPLKCGYAGRNLAALRAHAEVHITTREHACAQCTFTAKTARRLNAHVVRMHTLLSGGVEKK